MNVYEKLLTVQSELKAPKNQYNSFGKYNYRSCEDILEGAKPFLKQLNAILLVEDEIVLINSRYYVKSTAKFVDCESQEAITNSAYAREEESKKGMDSSQVTGTTSSYARKYALNGLFCIDDAKDADSMDNTKGNDKNEHICSECKREIKGFKHGDTIYTDEQAWDFALKRGDGVALCGYCAKKSK